MVTDDQKDKVLALYHQGEIIEAKKLSETLIQTNPNDAFSWKSLGYCLFKTGDYEDSIGALEASLELENEGDPTLFGTLARAYFSCGDYRRAAENQKKGLLIDPENSYWQFNMAEMLYKSGRGDEAMPYLERAEELGYAPENIMALKSSIFTLSFRFDEGLKEMEKLAEISPDDPAVHNNLGNLSTDLNDFKKASYHYSRAKELSPGSLLPYANEILSLHYDPSQTASSIRKKISEFSHLFPIEKMESLENEISKARSIKVGIISSHLKIHPVGWMLASTLEKLKNDIEIYVYSDSDSQDFLNSRIRNTVKNWNLTYHLDDKNLAKKITKDKIDILFDLAGYSGGTRILTFMHHPSPVIVKWIGGQISSMGIDAYDYFISDPIETPKGQDFEYTEKLIRLPNDYICYTPPEYAPEVTALPAMSNGHITFGCFNNPAKINNITLSQWADILKYIPGSNLLLKGAAYKTERAKERIWNVFTNSGIEKSRIILEGPESHRELLESYQRIDIALDPWPYSGGLTTCEALLMGVPVVTLPGPTFAGRHSATHLTNAGMPELVVNSWEEYRQRVIELASDLPSLAVIRASLRQVFINSPVCDAPRFARHFHKALRAIWQRHCEGKPPAALTFNKRGQAWFEDESTPVKIQSDSNTNGEFEWDFEGKIIAIDNGGQLLGNSAVREMLNDDYLELICFDPTTRAADNSLKSHTNVHYYPGVTLGNGQPVSIYRCSDSTLDGSLKPLIESQQAEVGEGQHPQQLEEHAIETISLDQIEGLPSIDWLVLDAVNDGATILEHGSKAMQDTLLVQARVAFQPTHENQLGFADLEQWMTRNGFRFYRFNNEQYRSYFPEDVPEEKRQATELKSADVIFIATNSRISNFTKNQNNKLSFLLKTIYGANDLAYFLFSRNKDHASINRFLPISEKYIGSSLSKKSNEKNISRYVEINNSIDLVDTENTSSYSYQDPSGVAVVMPCIDKELGLNTAKALVNRAGMPLKVIIAYDSKRQGFIKTLNEISLRCEVRYIVYLAQDAYPGMHWLIRAYNELEKNGNGLLAFNDGKWNGRIASFGMVRKAWAYSIYDQCILCPSYNSHCADDEITIIARCLNSLSYDPEIVLMEVDYQKGLKGGGNKHDRETLYKRASTYFNSIVEEKNLLPIAPEYGEMPKALRVVIPSEEKEFDPLISIVIPAYKETWFRDALKSALDQDYNNFEILICDDSESTAIADICDEYKKTTKIDIRYYKNTNRLGEIKNLPECIRRAKGDYIKPLYDDDTLHPNALSELIKPFKADKKLSLASALRNVINEQGRIIPPPSLAYMNPFGEDVNIDGKSLVSIFSNGLINFIGEPSSVLFPREIALSLGDSLFMLGGKVTEGRGDLSAWMNLLRRGNLVLLNKYLSNFRISSEQTSEQYRNQPNHEGITVFCNMIKQLGWQQNNCQVKASLRKDPKPSKFDTLDLKRFWKTGETINLTNSTDEEAATTSANKHKQTREELSSIIRESNSLEILKKIQVHIPERKFHDHIHILHDIRTLINKREANYVEIGSYVGHSASLMLSHDLKTKVYCIDPLSLPKNHYQGDLSQEQTLIKNLSKHAGEYTIIKEESCDSKALAYLEEQGIAIDILFIDGDHTYSSVIRDFSTYEKLVADGGFIVFDDYWDKNHSPDVYFAVNDIVEKIKNNRLPYEIIGSLANYQSANPVYDHGERTGLINEFILRKKFNKKSGVDAI
ncbi:glycosyltransferase [Modicisalibacter sp. 'Wilcox']|uniref:O-linked N-acetylglucosamine transferase family protein n=1 Tax=Modicisalibacter sp. 'Wilcox' TaxID=2679914 RepID=UPI0013D4F20D|nr:glycosyltransferase [Modicisalibacter sp. 'Wilcox']